MRTEIYIENQRLDLYKDISAEFTYNIDDVKDFSSRNTNFSKTIILPGNATNNKLFGHIFEFGSANFYNPTTDNVGYNFNASKSAACVVYVDKIQLFKGVIRLLEIVIDNGSIEYECAVFGELGGLVSSIGNKKLEDLDFSAYNHTWDVNNITTSWNQASGVTASGMGYFYPLIDYGQVHKNTHVDYLLSAFRPALFVREYMKKIIEGAGYTFTSTFFDSNLFKRLVIPNNQKIFSNGSDIAYYGIFSYLNATYSGTPTPRPLLIMDQVANAGYFTLSNGNTRFTYTGTPNTSIRFEFSIVGTTSDRTYINIRKNGVGAEVLQIEQGDINIQEQSTGYVSLVTNDYLEFQLDWDGYANPDSLTIFTDQLEVKFRASASQVVPLTVNETIIINNTIPRGIFQKDFFSSIVKMFNLYVTESADKTKHLNIEPYIDYYDLVDKIDWTLKVDRSKPFRIKPMSELNGRYFEYKYKTDSDFYNENYFKKYAQGYGDYLEDTGFEFANDKQTAEIIFAPSVLVGHSGEDKVLTTIYKLSNTENTRSEDPMDSVIRILQVRKISGVSGWHIKNIDPPNSNLSSTLTAYGYGGHLDDPDAPTSDINFGAPKEINFTIVTPYPSANLFNGFWSDYVAEITDKDSKLLTCNVRLTDMDIYSLDFSKLVWIDGSLWRLNKVIDYNPMIEDTTKCEFLKVIELTYA